MPAATPAPTPSILRLATPSSRKGKWLCHLVGVHAHSLPPPNAGRESLIGLIAKVAQRLMTSDQRQIATPVLSFLEDLA